MTAQSDLNARLAGAALRPFWADTVPLQTVCPGLAGDVTCDLAVLGGGFTGLWTALDASRRAPNARIVLIEAQSCGNAASGRSGGFCAPSISHGVGNALKRWPDEAETLIRLGRANLDAFVADLDGFGMAVEFAREGKLNLAATPWQVAGLKAMAANYRRFGIECRYLEDAALKQRFASPVYKAGLFEPNYATLNPAKMMAELRRVALAQGVEIYEETPAHALREDGDAIVIETPRGRIRAARVAMATNAAPPLLAKLKRAIVPIFDYAIMTRPLTGQECDSINWRGWYSVADSGNQFHYIRKSADNRILWGGYDAVYHYGSNRAELLLNRTKTFNRLAANFARALPQLAAVQFTHAWGGIIDTSARTTLFSGLAFGGRLAYAMGFTGQGVSASRFGALAMLDLLEGRDTERTRLRMLSQTPFGFPPEPFRYMGVKWAQAGLAREDETGRRTLLNKTLDALGVGFDS